MMIGQFEKLLQAKIWRAGHSSGDFSLASCVRRGELGISGGSVKVEATICLRNCLNSRILVLR